MTSLRRCSVEACHVAAGEYRIRSKMLYLTCDKFHYDSLTPVSSVFILCGLSHFSKKDNKLSLWLVGKCFFLILLIVCLISYILIGFLDDSRLSGL